MGLNYPHCGLQPGNIILAVSICGALLRLFLSHVAPSLAWLWRNLYWSHPFCIVSRLPVQHKGVVYFSNLCFWVRSLLGIITVQVFKYYGRFGKDRISSKIIVSPSIRHRRALDLFQTSLALQVGVLWCIGQFASLGVSAKNSPSLSGFCRYLICKAFTTRRDIFSSYLPDPVLRGFSMQIVYWKLIDGYYFPHYDGPRDMRFAVLCCVSRILETSNNPQCL